MIAKGRVFLFGSCVTLSVAGVLSWWLFRALLEPQAFGRVATVVGQAASVRELPPNPVGTIADEFDFDIPATTLEESVQLFTQQCGVGVMINNTADVAHTVQTHAIRGRMRAVDALDTMLNGTEMELIGGPKATQVGLRRKTGP